MQILPEYIADEPWMYTYHSYQSPGYIRFAMAFSGQEAPKNGNWCDLAYGQGVSLVIHAAGNRDIHWIGTDFNPDQVRFARDLARGGNIGNLDLYDQSLVDFSRRGDLPALDVVTNVGTWAWIPATDQMAVTELLSRRLSDTGAFLLVHTTLPGQSGASGLVQAFAALVAGDGSPGAPLTARIPGALRATLTFLDTNPSFANLHWTLKSEVESLLDKDPAHLAHEYFNHHFRPAWFRDVAGLMNTAGLDWACSWKPVAGIDELHLTPRQAAFLRGVVGATEREALRDIVLNAGGRADIWSRNPGAKQRDRLELLRSFSFVLARPADQFRFRIDAGLGEIALAHELYDPLVEELARQRPVRLPELIERLRGSHGPGEICDALAILLEQQMIQVVNNSADEVARSAGATRALNRHILELARAGDTVAHLASPLTGAGTKVSRLHRLFLLAESEGVTSVEARARFALDILEATPPAATAGLARPPPDIVLLERDAVEFDNRFLPVYRALMLTGPS